MPRKSNTATTTGATPSTPATTGTTTGTTTGATPSTPATTTAQPSLGGGTPLTSSLALASSGPSLGGGTPSDDAALKNINYKNMLLTGNYGLIKPDIVTNPNIDDILENEKNANKSDPWNKLDKSAKVTKLKEFASRHGKKENYSDQETTTLFQFLISVLDQKKLMRAKDVVYDKVSGTITSIPCLIFHAGLKKFTLKRCEKRQSTLKSLAPATSMSKKRKLASTIEDAQTPSPASAPTPAPAPAPSQ